MSDSSASPLRSPEDEELLAKSSRIRLWVTKRMKEVSDCLVGKMYVNLIIKLKKKGKSSDYQRSVQSLFFQDKLLMRTCFYP